MPKGFEGVRNASATLEARRSQGGGTPSLWFRLADGEETVVRFLEKDDEIHWAMMHEVPVEGRAWGRDVPCVDQDKEGEPCPGCERDLPLRFRGYINVIWDDAPVFKRDTQGRVVRDSTNDPVVVDHKPQVAIWSSGIRLFEELDEINANYRGLDSRRFKVKRKGQKVDTKYHITPENPDGGPQDFSDEEVKLVDAKFDLNEYVKPPTYDEFLETLEPVQRGGGGEQGPPRRANPFLKNR
jgi:hypothetical protein